MTGVAVANQQGCVLENERSFLLGVALEAGLLSERGGADLSMLDAAVRLMAIDTRHRLFNDPVMEWLRKLGPLLSMAAKAESVGRLPEQLGHRSPGVDPVTIGTGQAALRVHRGREALDFLVLIVTTQALFAVSGFGFAFERYDFGFVSPSGDVLVAGAVTGFAYILDLIERALL